MQFFTAILSALALAVSTTTATPVDARGALIVVTPPVTSPKAGDIWPIGSGQLVQWDTSGIPDQARDYTGSIVLGYDDGFSSSENLDYRKLPRARRLNRRSPVVTGKLTLCDPPRRKPARARL